MNEQWGQAIDAERKSREAAEDATQQANASLQQRLSSVDSQLAE